METKTVFFTVFIFVLLVESYIAFRISHLSEYYSCLCCIKSIRIFPENFVFLYLSIDHRYLAQSDNGAFLQTTKRQNPNEANFDQTALRFYVSPLPFYLPSYGLLDEAKMMRSTITTTEYEEDRKFMNYFITIFHSDLLSVFNNEQKPLKPGIRQFSKGSQIQKRDVCNASDNLL